MLENGETRDSDDQQVQQKRILRRAEETDLPALLAVEQTSFFSPWKEAAFLSEFANPYSRLWVVEEGENVIGYVCTWFIHDEGQIANMAVLPEHRRRGLGKILVHHVLQEARKQGVLSLSLEVRRSNHAALELYKSFGFQKFTVRVRYYENGEDALLMVCAVSHL